MRALAWFLIKIFIVYSQKMKYIVANWKAYVTTAKAAKALCAKTKTKKNVRIVLAPPFVFVPLVKSARVRGAALGAQDVFWEDEGPYTGEVTTHMLKDMGVTHVIIGHSERRQHAGETDTMVNKKVQAAVRRGLTAVVCVGEKEREDHRAIPALVGEQTRAALAGVPRQKLDHVIIAYEPIWAIGTGVADTPNDALSAALYIRQAAADLFGAQLARSLKVLYGGSVHAENVAAFVHQEGIDGVLIGKASASADEFVKILKNI